MSWTHQATTEAGGQNSVTMQNVPDECPQCHNKGTFLPLVCYHNATPTAPERQLEVIFRCPNSKCHEVFIGYYKSINGNVFQLHHTEPSKYVEREFTDTFASENLHYHSGNCPCPYNTDSRGDSCGGRSSYSKNGQISYCYDSDVSDAQVGQLKNSMLAKAQSDLDGAVQKDVWVYEEPYTVVCYNFRMAIKFITGNKNKFAEIQSVLNVPMERLDIDLPEIQSLDAREVIKQKLLAAEQHEVGEYIVEDTSLYLSCLNSQLPGPFIKWFEKSITNDGLVKLTQAMGDNKAHATVLIGYINEVRNITFFEGTIIGEIVPARGEKDFGWGPIFQPEGNKKTFGEMERDEKHAISMRGIAARKLKDFLVRK